MSPQTQRVFDKLQRQKAALLFELSAWPASHLCFRLTADSWSALEIVDHLDRVERGILFSMRQNLPAGQVVTFRDRLGAFTVRMVMLSPQRVKAPAATPMVLPGHVTDLAAVADGWTKTRNAMVELFDSLTSDHPRTGYFRHPRSGWMNLSHIVRFLSVHLRHHLYQIERVKRAARSSQISV